MAAGADAAVCTGAAPSVGFCGEAGAVNSALVFGPARGDFSELRGGFLAGLEECQPLRVGLLAVLGDALVVEVNFGRAAQREQDDAGQREGECFAYGGTGFHPTEKASREPPSAIFVSGGAPSRPTLRLLRFRLARLGRRPESGDQPRAPLISKVGVSPVRQAGDFVPEPDQEENVDKQPR